MISGKPCAFRVWFIGMYAAEAHTASWMYAGSDGILASTATKLHLLLQAAEGLVVMQDTVLQHASHKGSYEMVQLLLSNGASLHASHFMVRYTLTYRPDPQHGSTCDVQICQTH